MNKYHVKIGIKFLTIVTVKFSRAFKDKLWEQENPDSFCFEKET